METNNFGFEQYNIHRSKLIQLIKEGADIFSNLGQKSTSQSLHKLLDNLQSQVFRILVMGEFKRGKSTFINALLGEDVLPAYDFPTTAVINEVRYGEAKRAVVKFKHPLPVSIEVLSEEAKKHVAKYRDQATPPLEIPYDQIEEYVVIKNYTKKQEAAVAESPYERVELSYPTELLKQGVEIVDSPGLNENHTRTVVTIGDLPKADAIIYVLLAQALGSQSELDVIANEVNGNGFHDIFFIINKYDQIQDKGLRFKDYAYQVLEQLTDFGRKGIFFLSSKQALESKQNNDASTYKESNFDEFEPKLYEHLINNQGRIKLRHPIHALKGMLDTVEQIVKRKENTLNQDLSDLEDKYEKVLPILRQAETSRDFTLEKIKAVRLQMRDFARKRSYLEFMEIAEAIPDWTEELELEHKFKLISLNHKGQAEAISKEVENYLSDKIRERITKWNEESLKPEIERQSQEIQGFIQEGATQLSATLGRLSNVFSGISLSEEERTHKEASTAERILTSIGALLIGDLPMAAYGSKFGLKGLAGAVGMQLAIGVGLALLGVANPLVFIAAAFSGGIVSGLIRTNKMTDNMKFEIGRKVQEQFMEEITDKSETIANNLYESTEKISEAVKESFNEQIANHKEEVERALADKKQGELHVQQEKQMAQEQKIKTKLLLDQLKKLEVITS